MTTVQAGALWKELTKEEKTYIAAAMGTHNKRAGKVKEAKDAKAANKEAKLKAAAR